MVKRLLRKLKRRWWQEIHDSLRQMRPPKVHPSATLTLHKDSRIDGRIVVGKDSSVVIEEGVRIEDAALLVGEGCSVKICRNSILQNVSLDIRNRAVVELGQGAIFDSPERYPATVTVDDGTLLLAEKVHSQASEIFVRFGGRMTIGKYTGIGFCTEIRCEERIDIGAYGMISYDVCIYDTNAHSTEWRERRERIVHGYPVGAGEEKRPGTEPVVIGDDVWVGKGATITKGSVIGDRCVVGIRTVVGGAIVEADSVVVSQSPRIIKRKRKEEPLLAEASEE